MELIRKYQRAKCIPVWNQNQKPLFSILSFKKRDIEPPVQGTETSDIDVPAISCTVYFMNIHIVSYIQIRPLYF